MKKLFIKTILFSTKIPGYLKIIFENLFSEYKKLVTLPVFPKMIKQEINYVIKVVREYFS